MQCCAAIHPAIEWPLSSSDTHRICVIGAGPSGLATVKALRDRGLACECLEREDDVGGNWYFGRPNSSVYRSTHLISSKRLTEYADFPMPKAYPPYPSRQQVHEYLQAYAREFGLYENIEFCRTVERVEPAERGWRVSVSGEATPRDYDRLIIANGHHWSPRWPSYAGEFSGEVMHSHSYKSPTVLEGKRVLVVGAGNSGCDIAVEAAQHADAAWISVRRGYHFLPKFMHGKPIDILGLNLQRAHFPLWLRRTISAVLVRMALGPPHRFGLPRPDHQLFETHPIINSQLFYQIGHGRLKVKPDIVRLDGGEVEFADGTREAVDLVIYATGYDVRFPFIEESHLNWRDGLPDLHLFAFHPQRDDLFVIGMIQPNGGLWPLAELQAKLAAAFIAADLCGDRAADQFRQQKRDNRAKLDGGIHFLATPRHKLEVDYYTFRKHLRKLLAQFPAPIPRPSPFAVPPSTRPLPQAAPR